MVRQVIKRDGRKDVYNEEKIAQAIEKAARAVILAEHPEMSVGDVVIDTTTAKELAKVVTNKVQGLYTTRKLPKVEDIQDLVETVLLETGHKKTAKEYIIYRAERNKQREMKSDLMATMQELTFESAKDSDIKRENANIDGDSSMGTMLKYGSESAKEFVHLFMLDKEASEAHKQGDIHIHDLDFYTLTATCAQINLEKLFKNGFSTGHGYIREPKSIQSYASLACIAIQSNQNDMHKRVVL